MKLSDFLAKGSLWTAIEAVQPFPFIAEITPERMDALTDYQYGERPLFHKAEKLTTEDAAVLITTQFKESWLKLLDVMGVVDIAAGRVETEVEKVENLEARTNNSDSVNKVSAFDSDDLINNDGSSVNGGDTLDGERDRTLKRTVVDPATAFANLNLLDKHSIINTVLRDVSNALTLSIY